MRTVKSVPAQGSEPGAASSLAGLNKLTSNDRVAQLSVRVNNLSPALRSTVYAYAGDHPLGFPLFAHHVRGLCRWHEGRYVGLSTRDIDELEAYERAEDALDDISKCHVASVVMF